MGRPIFYPNQMHFYDTAAKAQAALKKKAHPEKWSVIHAPRYNAWFVGRTVK